MAKLRDVAALWAMIRMKQETAIPKQAANSWMSMPCGSPIGGNPPVTEPTTATPWAFASVTADTAMSNRTATIAPGTLGRYRLNPKMINNVAAAKAVVVQLS